MIFPRSVIRTVLDEQRLISSIVIMIAIKLSSLLVLYYAIMNFGPAGSAVPPLAYFVPFNIILALIETVLFCLLLTIATRLLLRIHRRFTDFVISTGWSLLPTLYFVPIAALWMLLFGRKMIEVMRISGSGRVTVDDPMMISLVILSFSLAVWQLYIYLSALSELIGRRKLIAFGVTAMCIVIMTFALIPVQKLFRELLLAASRAPN